jgi:hypothetical protein
LLDVGDLAARVGMHGWMRPLGLSLTILSLTGSSALLQKPVVKAAGRNVTTPSR